MSIINSQPRIGAAGQSTGYKIERSLRFNSADSANLNRTFSTPTNNKIWTFSAWVKIGGIGTSRQLLSGGSAIGDQIFIGTADTIYIYLDGAYRVITTAVFRDPSAWYHIVVAVDTTQATGSNRTKVYVNNVEHTGTGTAITQNNNTKINSASAHYIGTYLGSSEFMSGYMTEIYFVDGQQLTPSSFGETDSATGVWKPKAYSGSYGTNGFYLKFADNSGTTSTTLGKDSSGNGNNWTPNNFSVTAGVGNDSVVDTPTPYGTDTGAGGEVRGNYCTLNPLNNPANSTLTNGNLDVTTASSTGGRVVGTVGVSSGKWYWEITPTSVAGQSLIGIAAASRVSSGGVGDFSDDYAYQNNGNKYSNSVGTAYGASYVANDVIGVALDLDAGTLVFYKNNSSQGTAYSSISGTFVPAMSDGQNANSSVFVCNFGQRPFAYTAPSGFKALCTQNLPTPTIGATATTRADDYFNTVLYTGNGSTQTISGVGFQPDLVWAKSRSNAYYHTLIDAVRGRAYILCSNRTDADAGPEPSDKELTAFTSDGFSLGPDYNLSINTNTATFVAWNWKANGAGSTNTSGTITSTVSANTTAGFSIVTYTGNGTSGATVGHGLSVSPNMVIIKNRTTAIEWPVYHSSLSAGYILFLDVTNGQGLISGSASGGVSAVSSTTFTCTQGVTNINNVNKNTDNYVAYCFASIAGYSAFGSYTGNGSADGPFSYTGFRPAYVLLKNTTTGSSDWIILDNKRNAYNVADLWLYANSSSAEATVATADFLSNGFKLKYAGGTSLNTNGDTYIYAAFAEHPFKYALAR